MPLYSRQRPCVTISYIIIGKTKLEYEFLYNLMDQTMLFLRMCPENNGYAEEILATLDEVVETLGRRLEKECD